MSKLDIVITMAGLGVRFRKVGYDVPKYMIEVKGKTLFEWSISSLEGYRNNVENYIFIVTKDPKIDVERFIVQRCSDMKITNFEIMIINKPTDGQATTAYLAKKYWNPENSLLIYNIDTYVEPGEMNYNELKGDGFIPCFSGEGDHWSFVRLEDGKVVEIKEKERISNHCTVGAYYFKTCKLYEKLYTEYYSKDQRLVNGEKYIAPLYDYLAKNGGKIYISDIPSNKVHVLGTPEELRAFEIDV